MAELGREHSRLVPLAQLGGKLQRLYDELAQARELVAIDDPEMAAEARAEVDRLQAAIDAMELEVKPLLVPRDPLDDRNCIVEIRPGTGGDEAALFAADLFRMYQRFADSKRWRVEIISMAEGTAEPVWETRASLSRGNSVRSQRAGPVGLQGGKS